MKKFLLDLVGCRIKYVVHTVYNCINVKFLYRVSDTRFGRSRKKPHLTPTKMKEKLKMNMNYIFSVI